jgi:hypothetical protein
MEGAKGITYLVEGCPRPARRTAVGEYGPRPDLASWRPWRVAIGM